MKTTEIRDKILEMCKEKGWKMDEFAKRSGVSKNTIKSMFYKKGTYIPGLYNLERICENAFGMTVAHFLSQDQEDVLVSLDEHEIELILTLRTFPEKYRGYLYEYMNRLQTMFEKSDKN